MLALPSPGIDKHVKSDGDCRAFFGYCIPEGQDLREGILMWVGCYVMEIKLKSSLNKDIPKRIPETAGGWPPSISRWSGSLRVA